jgi:hypothetical protein
MSHLIENLLEASKQMATDEIVQEKRHRTRARLLATMASIARPKRLSQLMRRTS